MSEDYISNDIRNNLDRLHERSQKTKSDLLTHEAICAERYKFLQETLDRMNKAIETNSQQIAELHKLATESKVSLKTIFFLGSVSVGIAGFVYTILSIFNRTGM